jgi:hypothetical protein
MNRNIWMTAALAAALALPVMAPAADHGSKTVYVARLHPMNTKVTGRRTSGRAKFIVNGGTLTIKIKVRNAPPNIVHWQHFHGFKNGKPATCAPASADKNGDGIVDLIETHSASGKTMVPFDEKPAAMDVARGKYPKASSKGQYTYQKKVSLTALKAAFAKAFNGQPLDLGRRVVYIHGVPVDAKLPSSVASLGSIPAHVTLPIACGEIHRAKR